MLPFYDNVLMLNATSAPLHPVAGPSIVNSIIEENLNRYLHERYSAVVECMSRVKQRFAGHEELNREFTDILKSYPPIDYVSPSLTSLLVHTYLLLVIRNNSRRG